MDKKQKQGSTPINRKAIQDSTFREENTGKKRVDANSMLRMEHLQKLATWASVEVGIPPLGALFGHRLCASAEVEGVPPDPSTFYCHRCESVLQPGFNCTVRIEKIRKATKLPKKQQNLSQNKVVYKCHFCSHPNILRGTQRGYLKGLLPSNPKPTTDTKVKFSSSKMNTETLPQKNQEGLELDAVCNEVSLEKSPPTLLEILANSSKKKRKMNKKSSVSASITETMSANSEGTGGSSKRRRKGWSSLKKIAESTVKLRGVTNFSIPFILGPDK